MVAAGVTPKLGDERPRRAGVDVRLASADAHSGLADMLASLLEDNVRDFRTRALAARLARGDVVLRAEDRDLAVTLSFRPGEVVVRDGTAPGAPVLAGEWLELARMCSGQRSPVAAVASGELRVTGLRGMRAATGAGVALSVPKSFYEADPSAFRRRRAAMLVLLVLGATAALGAAAALRAGARRRRTSGRARGARAVPAVRPS
jgi:hypothetical protein